MAFSSLLPSSLSSNGLTATGVPTALALLAIASFALIYFYANFLKRPQVGKNAPPLTAEDRWLVGSWAFFTERWDFIVRGRASTKSGNFSFFVGRFPVIGLSGPAGRKVFYEHRNLSFTEGYTTLFGGGASIRDDAANNADEEKDDGMIDDNGSTGFGAYFNRRVMAMVKGQQLRRGLPQMLRDARANLDSLVASQGSKAVVTTDPFESVYRMVYQITMRTVACNEIADDPVLLESSLRHFESIESSTSALSIMYPWLPLPSKTKRVYAGLQLYRIFKKVIDERKKHNRTDDDALQYLLDQGDNVVDIITFVLGALFAGQLNSGINAAYVISFLANDKHWLQRVVAEVRSVADKYASDRTAPLRDRLMSVPAEAWETEFPVIDICLKDSIRLNLPGVGFRLNNSGHDIPIADPQAVPSSLPPSTEVIPAGTFVAYATGETFYDPEIFAEPEKWDPSRYLPPRNEDKKEQYAYTGWGAARHPCLGMRFAKLEISIIVAFWCAYFEDWDVVKDQQGSPFAPGITSEEKLPLPSRNNLTAKKPERKVWLGMKVRQ